MALLTRSTSRSMQLEGTAQCRFCFDDDAIVQMFRPCKCKGSLAYVHVKCLDEWRKTSSKANCTCTICETPYKMTNGGLARNVRSILSILINRPLFFVLPGLCVLWYGLNAHAMWMSFFWLGWISYVVFAVCMVIVTVCCVATFTEREISIFLVTLFSVTGLLSPFIFGWGVFTAYGLGDRLIVGAGSVYIAVQRAKIVRGYED